MVNLLADELAGLRAGRLSFTRVLPRSSNRLRIGHGNLLGYGLNVREGATSVPSSGTYQLSNPHVIDRLVG
jgi:hypothetical protein